MDKRLAIFNSDQVSRDGTRFTISALEDGVWMASVFGIPSNLSHDVHRPVGWAYAKGLYFEPTRVLTVGYFLIAVDEKDIASISKARQAFFANRQNREIAPHADKFKEILGRLYKEKEGNWFSCGMVLYGYKDIVLEAFPELANNISADKDGLVNLADLLNEFDYLAQGAFRKKGSDLGIIAHPYFRKSFSIYNNFHWKFLDELIALHKREGIASKIRLDLDYLGYAPSYLPAHEFEYWWGPKYNDDIADIQPGLTQHGSDEFERLYYSILRTEFVWTKEGDLHTLELEEVRDQPAPTLVDTYACRYVHSIFDKGKKGFNHFDGAIRAYDTELMLERVEKKITEMGRRSRYTKLFRVDGNLPLSDWKSLVTNYLQGNPQIYEYFGLPKPGVQTVADPEIQTPFEKYVPYSMNRGEGVRLYVSYHAKVDEQPHPRFVSSHDEITLEDGPQKAIEFFTIELRKVFQRLGVDLVLPNDCIFIIPEDYYSNIPCIFHGDVKTQQLVDDTVKCLKILLARLVTTSKREVLSTTLAWNIEDKKVVVSVIGHIADLSTWFNSFSRIPVSREDFKSWLTSQAKFIKSNGKGSVCPVLGKVICDDGTLYMKRRPVHEDATISFPDKTDPMRYELSIDEGKEDLANSVNDRKLFIAPTMILKKMLCEKSGQDYIESPYSVVLDDDAKQKLVSCKLISFHWTDKPRPIAFE